MLINNIRQVAINPPQCAEQETEAYLFAGIRTFRIGTTDFAAALAFVVWFVP